VSKHKDLIVFQKADDLVFRIYQLTKMFPKEETFGITSQLRRASLSIPTNIVEGYARKSKKELIQFISVAVGSLAVTEYLYDFSKRLGYLKEDTSQIETILDEVGRLLRNFYRSL
jgi:four helix bundle protein